MARKCLSLRVDISCVAFPPAHHSHQAKLPTFRNQSINQSIKSNQINQVNQLINLYTAEFISLGHHHPIASVCHFLSVATARSGARKKPPEQHLRKKQDLCIVWRD